MCAFTSITHKDPFAAIAFDFCTELPASKILGRKQVSGMQIITNTAKAHGCSAEVDWMEEAHPYYPPTINNPDLAAFVKNVGGR